MKINYVGKERGEEIEPRVISCNIKVNKQDFFLTKEKELYQV